ncbi:hypothetical protein EBZ39_02930 [bacterium]|nr:hypothetical protein [bacterium]
MDSELKGNLTVKLSTFTRMEDEIRELTVKNERLSGLVDMHVSMQEWAVGSDSVIASCACDTKTNDPAFHAPGCKYRLICERDKARAENVKLSEALAKILTLGKTWLRAEELLSTDA